MNLVDPRTLEEFDEISITGTAVSPAQKYTNYRCTVITVTRDDFLKVLSVTDDKLVWFAMSAIEKCELVR